MFALLWKFKYWLIGAWVAMMIVVLIVVLRIDFVYTSSCLLMPTALQRVEAQTDRFGGSMRGFFGVGMSSRDDYIVISTIDSRVLMDLVIEETGVKQELFADRWDAENNRWEEGDGWGDGEPTPEETRQRMDSALDINFNEFTSHLTVSVNWGTAERAREILYAILTRSDQLLKEKAITDGERRVAELRREMEKTTHEEVARFLAEQMTSAISTLASIRSSSPYAYSILDPPSLPEMRSWPPRGLLMMIAGIVWGLVELGVIAFIHIKNMDPAVLTRPRKQVSST